jgi:malate synthase
MMQTQMNAAPRDFRAQHDLPPGFMTFYRPLHDEFTPRQKALVVKRAEALGAAHQGRLPAHLPPSAATRDDWKIVLPEWCRDQRNQMMGPADDTARVVRMLNSGAPGVVLDLEDSMANRWPCLMRGLCNILGALRGDLSYSDPASGATVAIEPSSTVVWIRVRGLDLGQGGLFPGGEISPAPLFDLAMIAHQLDANRLRRPLCIYIPKAESAEEASWWRDVFRAVARAKGWTDDAIRCMALVESHPLAHEMEEFLHPLRDHILGLSFERWDYTASLIHFNFENPDWVLPDRNTIPHDVPFLQRVRLLLTDICHRRGALAIGGPTRLCPNRENPDLNARALALLEQEKQNEATCFMDGTWTGHPDQTAIAVARFPVPNQLHRRAEGIERYPDLRPVPHGVGARTAEGTRVAVSAMIRYRNGVLNGRGASLLDGCMEDLATDRINRLMIAQRIRHRRAAEVMNGGGKPAPHSKEFVRHKFNEALELLIQQLPSGRDPGDERTLREALRLSEEMIGRGWFKPE